MSELLSIVYGYEPPRTTASDRLPAMFQ